MAVPFRVVITVELQELEDKMTIRYQRGHLKCTKQKLSLRVGMLWRDNDVTGKRLRRTAVIGTVEQYPNEDLALSAVNGLMVSINEAACGSRKTAAPP